MRKTLTIVGSVFLLIILLVWLGGRDRKFNWQPEFSIYSKDPSSIRIFAEQLPYWFGKDSVELMDETLGNKVNPYADYYEDYYDSYIEEDNYSETYDSSDYTYEDYNIDGDTVYYEVNEDVISTVDDSYEFYKPYKNTTYLVLSDDYHYHVDQSSLQELLNIVDVGGKAFICSFEFPELLKDKLGFDCKEPFALMSLKGAQVRFDLLHNKGTISYEK